MKNIIAAVSLILITCSIKAQVDPHFSQFYAYPLWLNPGMTGVMDGDYRITAIYRNQWSAVMTPFTTAGFSADFSTSKNINAGINFINQTAGDAGYRYTNAYGTVAYNGIKFGNNNTQQVVIGIQAGMLSRGFDRSKFQFGDQWNPITGYNPGASTADNIDRTTSSVFDVGVGVGYFDGDAEKKVNIFGGLSAFHLTKPEDPFVKSGEKKFLPVRFGFHAGARITLNENASLTPNILYMKQGTASEKMIGVFAQLKANEFTDLLAGLNLRLGDAISPYAGVAFQNFVVGLSYDVTSSELSRMAKGSNSLEISLTYIGRTAGKPLRYLSCPRF